MLLFALMLGIVSGLRAMTSPAVVSWAARASILTLAGTHLAFLGYEFTPYILTLLALGELINDKRPSTPSRKVPAQLIGRLISGALVGASVGAPSGAVWLGGLIGIVGALIGTYGGSAARTRLAAAFGRDLPAALIEDVVAIGLAVLVVARIR